MWLRRKRTTPLDVDRNASLINTPHFTWQGEGITSGTAKASVSQLTSGRGNPKPEQVCTSSQVEAPRPIVRMRSQTTLDPLLVPDLVEAPRSCSPHFDGVAVSDLFDSLHAAEIFRPAQYMPEELMDEGSDGSLCSETSLLQEVAPCSIHRPDQQGSCRPCRFVFRSIGCRLKADCGFCHHINHAQQAATEQRVARKKQEPSKLVHSNQEVILHALQASSTNRSSMKCSLSNALGHEHLIVMSL